MNNEQYNKFLDIIQNMHEDIIKRFDNMDKRLDTIDKKLDDIGNKVNEHETKFRKMKKI